MNIAFLGARCLASEVKVRCVVLERRNGKGQISLASIGILEGVPEGCADTEEGATDFLPVTLHVVERSNGITRDGSNCEGS